MKLFLPLLALAGGTTMAYADTIPEVATAAGTFTTLVLALGAAGLVDTLSGEGPFTVFAPDDDAFDVLPDSLKDCLFEPDNKADLVTLLTYHVVSGKVMAAQVTDGLTAPTVQTEELVFDVSDTGVIINGAANVVATDIAASNGVIHVIDAVLVPEALTGTTCFPSATDGTAPTPSVTMPSTPTVETTTDPATQVYQVFYINGGEADDGDATIFSNEPDQASGGDNLYIGCDGTESCARSLLRFDISTMPSDAIVTDVQLVLVPRNSGEEGTVDVVMDVHQVTSPWTRTVDSVLDGETDIAGTFATMGDVTWKYSTYQSVEWMSEGGDVSPDVMSTATSVAGTMDNTFFTTTDSFKAVMEGWIDGSIPNYGFLVKRQTEVATEAGVRQYFHEASGNKSRRSPKLLVTYSSVSQPMQMPSPPSGPGILLINEPTPAPVTPRPTNAYTCPQDKADTLVHMVTSDADATIFEDQDEISADALTWAVGLTRNGIRRGLLRFPLDGIPFNSKITCAEIVLSSTGPCGPCQHTVDIEIFSMTSDWSSSGINAWVQHTESGKLTEIELEGLSANTGDATWAYSNYNAANPAEGTMWTTPGGDFEQELLSAEVDNGGEPTKFPTNPDFVDLIQSFVDGERENFGFMVKTEDSDEYKSQVANENTYKDHDSAYRVFHGFDADDETKRPLLVVHYESRVNSAPSSAIPEVLAKGSTSADNPFTTSADNKASTSADAADTSSADDGGDADVQNDGSAASQAQSATMLGGIAAFAAFGAML